MKLEMRDALHAAIAKSRGWIDDLLTPKGHLANARPL
jgi:hypothetical protein